MKVLIIIILFTLNVSLLFSHENNKYNSDSMLANHKSNLFLNNGLLFDTYIHGKDATAPPNTCISHTYVSPYLNKAKYISPHTALTAPQKAVTNSIEVDSNVVKIGNQIWQKRNLNVSTFRNGDTIFHAKNIKEWNIACKSNIPAWCYYNNDSKNEQTIGKLYNWFAVIDKRRLAPKGWHIPTYNDFMELNESLGGRDIDLRKLAKISAWPWHKDSTEESGFDAYPSGQLSGSFRYKEASAIYWTTDTNKENQCYVLILNGDFPSFGLLKIGCWGFSVRCLLASKKTNP